MEENSVGIIGQKYENRKTGKTGTLVRRREERHLLVMLGFGDSEFCVTYGDFRSNWRKSQDKVEEVKTEEVKEIETIKEEEVVEEVVSLDGMSINQFIDEAFEGRIGNVVHKGNTFDVFLTEGKTEIQVVHIEKNDMNFLVSMLPDIYTYSDLSAFRVSTSFDMKVAMSVTCILNCKTLEEILKCICEAVHDINLYGYVVEEE